MFEVNYNFTLSQGIYGPLLAVAVGVQFLFTLMINLFLSSFTLCYPKTLKEPSIIFLTNFVFVYLLMTIVVMP